MSGALAAGLAFFIAIAELPEKSGKSFVALINRGGDLPALIVEVNTGAGMVKIHSVAAETPPDHSLELWYIGTGQAPRSLGTIDDPWRQVALPAVARSADLDRATLAVTVEPKGGSPTGGPTGPVVYSGKLIRE